MLSRLSEYLKDPDFGGTRRTLLLGGIMLAVVGSLAAIAFGRKKTTLLQGAQPLAENGSAALRACVCPRCGSAVARRADLECEKIRCPRCAADMEAGFYFLGEQGSSAPTRNAPQRTLTQPLALPAPVNVAPRDNWFQRAPAWPESPFQQILAMANPPAAPFAAPMPEDWFQDVRPVNFVPQRPGASTVCVCPRCGSRVPNDGHLFCPGLRCPNCQGSMMPGVRVGAMQPASSPASTAAPPPSAGAPTAAVPTAPTTGARGELVGGAPFADGLATSPLRPVAAVSPGGAGSSYDAAVSGIVSRNCLRCHGGAMRNLSTYQNLKSYATSGLLMMMVQPGGPMSHFLAPAEAQQIIDWVDAGGPR
jgi:hypothetical protein